MRHMTYYPASILGSFLDLLMIWDIVTNGETLYGWGVYPDYVWKGVE